MLRGSRRRAPICSALDASVLASLGGYVHCDPTVRSKRGSDCAEKLSRLSSDPPHDPHVNGRHPRFVTGLASVCLLWVSWRTPEGQTRQDPETGPLSFLRALVAHNLR